MSNMSVSTHGSEVRSQLLQLREKTAELRRYL